MKLPRLYPILDTAAAAACACTPREAAQAMLQAGVEILQWRHKGHLTRAAFDLAAGLAADCQRIHYVINDRADLAALFHATLHLGQDDLPPSAARQLVSPLGLSTHNEAQLTAANAEPVEYHALGPIFSTASKEKPDPEVGLENLRRWRPLSQRPLVAIGGISLAQAPRVLEAGADSIAVIGALLPPGATAAQIEDLTRQWMRALA